MFQLSLTSYGQSQISSTVYIDGVALVAAHIDNISSLENLSSLTTVFDDESAGNFNGSSVNIRINDLSSSAYQACTILLYQGSGNNKKVVAGYSHSSAIVSKTAAQELNLFLSFDASCFTNGCMLSSIQVTPATASVNADGIVHIENESTSADDTYSVYSKAQIDSILESSIPTVNNATLTIQKNGSTVNTFTANASSDVTANITVPLESISVNGTTQTITNRNVDIHIPADITNAELIGGFVRYNVSGSGNLTISNTYGLFPYSSGTTTTLPAGTYLVRVRLRSTTASYSVTVNFGTPYTLTSSNGVIDDLRSVTLSSAQGFSASITQVNANTYIRVVLYEQGNVVTSVGPAAVTNDYNDLNNIPNGTLVIQKNGSNVASFSASADSNVTANITVPTTVASLSDASNYVTTNTTQTITGEKTFSADTTLDYESNIILNYSDDAIPDDSQTVPEDNYARLYTNTRHEMETSGDGSTVPNVVLDLGPYYYTDGSIIESDGSPEFLIMRDDTRVAQFGSYVYLNQLGRHYDAITQAYITQVGDSFHPSTKIYSNQFIKYNGTSSQFLKADGSTDSTSYLTSSSLSNYVTTNTVQTITGEKTFEDVVFHVDNADSDSDLVLDLYHYDDDGTDTESSELTLRPVTDDYGNLGDYTHRYYNIWADNFHGTLYGNASALSNTRYIDGVGFNGSSNIAHYGECSTGASTQIKDVTIPNFNLVTGARVIVKFANTNTVSNPQLRVNTSGTNGTAKSIVYRGTSVISSSSNYYRWQAGSSIEFIYDGTNWAWVGFQEYAYYAYSANSSNYLYTSSGYYVAQAYYSNPTRAIVPYSSSTTSDLGTASNRWRTLYLSTSISDGTNTYSLPSSTGTLALTSDIPEEIFCIGQEYNCYDEYDSDSVDYRPASTGLGDNNPKHEGNGISITVSQYVNLTTNLRLSVYIPTQAYVGSIAFPIADQSEHHAYYPIYFRGDESDHNPTVPAGSILRLTFRNNAFYNDFYDLADFGVEHEPIVRVGNIPHYRSIDSYNGALVASRRRDGKFDTLITVNESEVEGVGHFINETILNYAACSPIYASFRGTCFSAHPRVPFGFITNLEYIYDRGESVNFSNLKFVYVEDDSIVDSSSILESHIITNPKSKSDDRYFHVPNAPVYILYESCQITVPNTGGMSNYIYIAIGGLPNSRSVPYEVGKLIGFLPSSAEEAGLLRLVNTKFDSSVAGYSLVTDKIVLQSSNSDSSYPIVFSSGLGQEYPGIDRTLYTDTSNSIYYNPSSNTLTCTTFSGSLSGNATSAGLATSIGGNSNTVVATFRYVNDHDRSLDPYVNAQTSFPNPSWVDLGSASKRWNDLYMVGDIKYNNSKSLVSFMLGQTVFSESTNLTLAKDTNTYIKKSTISSYITAVPSFVTINYTTIFHSLCIVSTLINSESIIDRIQSSSLNIAPIGEIDVYNDDEITTTSQTITLSDLMSYYLRLLDHDSGLYIKYSSSISSPTEIGLFFAHEYRNLSAGKLLLYKIPCSGFRLNSITSTTQGTGHPILLYNSTTSQYSLSYDYSYSVDILQTMTLNEFVSNVNSLSSTHATKLSYISGSDITTKLTAESNQVTSSDDIIPGDDNTYDLGSSSYAWKSIFAGGGGTNSRYYIQIGYDSGIDDTSEMSIKPSYNNCGHIGTPDYHWYRAYINNLYIGSNATALSTYIANTTVTNATNATNATSATNLRYSTTNVLSATSTSQVTARANIIPNTNSTSTTTGYSLGSSDYKWGSIYGNTIYGAPVIPSGFALLSGSTWTVSSPLTPDITYSGTPPMGTTIIVYFGSTNTASNPQLKFGSWDARPLYRSSGTYAGTTVATSWPAGSFLLLRYNTNDNVWYLCNGNSYPTSTASGTTNIIPSSNATYDLGSSAYKWDDIFVNYVGSSSSKVSYGYFNYCSISTLRDGSNNNLATLSSAGIIPTTDSTSTSTGVDLGSTSYRWRNIYAAGYPATSTVPSIKIGIDDNVDDAYKMFVGPTTNNAGQLGSSSLYWFKVYSTNITGTNIYGKLVSLYGTGSGALYVFKLSFNNTSGSSVTLSRGQNLGSLPSGVTITAYQERMDDTGSAGTSYSTAISGTYYTCMQIVLSTGTSTVYVPCIRG